jgi:hypothetical protein
MELSQRLEQILGAFRPVFSREATFGWFVLLVWGILLNTQPAAVTSYINALGLSEGFISRRCIGLTPGPLVQRISSALGAVAESTGRRVPDQR